jgi:PAS domain-containing protein
MHVIVTSLQKASLIKGGCSALGPDVERDYADMPGVCKIRSIQGFLVALFSARPSSWFIGVEPLPGRDDAAMTFGEGESSAFHAAIEMSLVPIVLADPHQPDDPIIFANGAFCELTGYDIDEIVAFCRARQLTRRRLPGSGRRSGLAGMSRRSWLIIGKTAASSGMPCS